jgi:dihydrofolate reductase
VRRSSWSRIRFRRTGRPPTGRCRSRSSPTASRGAVEQAAAAAGAEGWIGVCGPDIIQQCLREGLLDELRIDLVPAFLGDGIRFFDGLPADVARLRNPRVVEGDRVTHLIYPVER